MPLPPTRPPTPTTTIGPDLTLRELDTLLVLAACRIVRLTSCRGLYGASIRAASGYVADAAGATVEDALRRAFSRLREADREHAARAAGGAS
jgi:Arc/MetJ family transcription regulator